MPAPVYAGAFALGLSLTLAACGGGEARPAADADTSMAAPAAPAQGGVTAALRDASGRDLGTVTLDSAAQGITLSGRLTGLPPGEHAFHLHASGGCEPPSFESAGGHWNPTDAAHGTESPKGPHFGDLPNITVGPDSAVAVNATTPGGTLRGENALLDADGAAVVVHQGTDDYKSQPSGDAGDRIACGVVSGGA